MRFNANYGDDEPSAGGDRRNGTTKPIPLVPYREKFPLLLPLIDVGCGSGNLHLAMKINRYGQAKVLTQSEIQLIFSQGLETNRDRTLFGVCLFSACRIREACTLQTQDIYTTKGQVRAQFVLRKSNTKGKLATRSIPVIEDLRLLLAEYYPQAGKRYLFPGRSSRHISHDSAARIFRQACDLAQAY